MATLTKAESRRMYSWWWNSHISPKNSKWLQENLSDMDNNVKSMIKLIEEEADSFARRAEMFYEKRPELMKMVEEFYRAYRALAERYDHATVLLRQAHRTMAEAFPSQVPSMSDDSSVSSASWGDPQTPKTRIPAFFDLENLPKDALELPRCLYDSESGSKGTVNRSLKFNASDEDSLNQFFSEAENVVITEKEIASFKEALAKLEDEKEAGLKQYQESLERLSKLELEISDAQQNSRELTDRATKAESKAQTLKDALLRLEAEKSECLKLYHQCLDKISEQVSLLEELSKQTKNSETAAELLRQDITRLEDEKNAAHDQYKCALETISDLKKKLKDAEEEASKLSEHVEKAECEVETLKQTIAKLTKEKEAQLLLYQQSLETISSLEFRFSYAQAEAKRLNGEIDNGVAKLKGVEEQRQMLERSHQALHSELVSKVVKMGTQTEELTEKQKELGRLWTCIQEERLRFAETQTAFETLQCLHSQAQEELRSLASELQNRAQNLRETETLNEVLQAEIQEHKEANKNLDMLNLSSVISLKNMLTEIETLKESKGKLEEEVELRVDQRNSLQQEMLSLKEELNELNTNHRAILEQVAQVGLNPECFGPSVKELQDENSNLKEQCKVERREKIALLEKLEIMSQLLETNVVLKNSLSDLGAELDGQRAKIKALEESYRLLLDEKSTLVGQKANLLGQLQVTSENMNKLSAKHSVLENSFFDTHVQLEVLKHKSEEFKDSCQFLADERFLLINENGTLSSQMESAEKSLKDMELRYRELEAKYSAMEKERESTLCKAEELRESLAIQNQQHVTFAQMNEKRLDNMRSQVRLLREGFDKELDKALGSEIETFVLLRCVQDLEEKNVSLCNECLKLQEASDSSERLIHELKQEINENRVEKKLNEVQMETLLLKEKLRQSEHELEALVSIRDQLNSEGSEHTGATQQLTILENEKTGLEEKVRELTKVCVSLQEQNSSKDVNIESLKQRFRSLERENKDLKAHLAACDPALESLRNCVLFLENRTCIRPDAHKSYKDEAKDDEPVNHLSQDHHTTRPGALANSQDQQSLVRAIETSVLATENLTMQEHADADSKPEAATRQIENFRNKTGSRRVNHRSKSISEISEADSGLLPKDIMLDHISERSSLGMSKTGVGKGEIWEIADQTSVIDMYVENTEDMGKVKQYQIPAISEDAEEELDVSKRFKPPPDESNKRKVLQRLNSDVQKLTNLQITIDDLKSKVEITVNSRRGKPMLECETLKGQLVDAETAILKLFQLNSKLVKHFEDANSSSPGKSTTELESQSTRRKRISDQARRVSEKIGRLQLEVQKIQFLLLKMDDEKEPKGKIRSYDTKKRVLLKDYLYGTLRPKSKTITKRKKPHFCACVEPPTKGD